MSESGGSRGRATIVNHEDVAEGKMRTLHSEGGNKSHWADEAPRSPSETLEGDRRTAVPQNTCMSFQRQPKLRNENEVNARPGGPASNVEAWLNANWFQNVAHRHLVKNLDETIYSTTTK